MYKISIIYKSNEGASSARSAGINIAKRECEGFMGITLHEFKFIQ